MFHIHFLLTLQMVQLHASLIGTVVTSNLSLPATFDILKLTINIISIGQLCDLRLNIIFSSSGCHFQDPRMGQIVVRIWRKV